MLDSYIIYLPKSELSVSVANKSIERFEKIYGTSPIKWKGVDKYDVWQKFIDSGFKVKHRRRFTNIDAEIATFFSHFSLWKKCVEVNKNILILEHDAWVDKKIDENLLELYNGDVLNIGKPNWGSFLNHPIESSWLSKSDGLYQREICNKEHDLHKHNPMRDDICYCDTMWLFGAHAYVVTPQGAQKLIDDCDNGILPTDVYIRRKLVTIHDLLPHSIRQKSTFSFIQRWKVHHRQEINNWDY